jgi:hypothetical protein
LLFFFLENVKLFRNGGIRRRGGNLARKRLGTFSGPWGAEFGSLSSDGR